MQIQVTTRHGHLKDSTREKITAKAEKLLKFFERLTAIEVVVDLNESDRPRVDIKVSAEHKHDFVSHDQGDNLLSVVDSALHKIEQQLRRYKDRVQSRHRDAPAKRMDEGVVAPGEDDSEE